jgi:hypothetical protein
LIGQSEPYAFVKDADDSPVRDRGQRWRRRTVLRGEHKILAQCPERLPTGIRIPNGRGRSGIEGVGSHHGTSQTRIPLLARPAEPCATFTGTERGGAQHITHERGGWQ